MVPRLNREEMETRSFGCLVAVTLTVASRIGSVFIIAVLRYPRSYIPQIYMLFQIKKTYLQKYSEYTFIYFNANKIMRNMKKKRRQ